MKNYYAQKGVMRAIIDFVYSGSQTPSREGAFFNKKIGKIQRHSPNGDSILVIDSEDVFSQAIRAGAKAFYSSYWRYRSPSEASGLQGRDLAWSLKAVEGGLSAAKEGTNMFLEVLEKVGFSNPLVKYSGDLGFDILIPLEDLQTGSPDDLDFISEIHENLTSHFSDYLKGHGSFDLKEEESPVRFSGSSGTCLLTELKWRRGLILAPMSLHPRSGLVSVPLLPREIPEFSVIEATPEKVRHLEWSISQEIPHERTEHVFSHTSEPSTLTA